MVICKCEGEQTAEKNTIRLLNVKEPEEWIPVDFTPLICFLSVNVFRNCHIYDYLPNFQYTSNLSLTSGFGIERARLHRVIEFYCSVNIYLFSRFYHESTVVSDKKIVFTDHKCRQTICRTCIRAVKNSYFVCLL